MTMYIIRLNDLRSVELVLASNPGSWETSNKRHGSDKSPDYDLYDEDEVPSKVAKLEDSGFYTESQR